MKKQENKLSFKLESLVELNNSELLEVNGGTSGFFFSSFWQQH